MAELQRFFTAMQQEMTFATGKATRKAGKRQNAGTVGTTGPAIKVQLLEIRKGKRTKGRKEKRQRG